jgi:hypothetical protein
VNNPKDDGYRAIHLINRNRSRLIEVQLRTPRQDTWANIVETYSRTIAPGLKFGSGPPELRDYFIALGEFFAAQDQDIKVDISLFERVQELQNQVDTLVKRFINES